MLTCGIGRRCPDKAPLPSHGLGDGRAGRLGLHARLCCRLRCSARLRRPLCLHSGLRCAPLPCNARRWAAVHLHRRLCRAAPLCSARPWRVNGCRAGHRCRVERLRAAGRLATHSCGPGQGTPVRVPVRSRRQPGLHACLCSVRRRRMAVPGSARTLEVRALRQVGLHARCRCAARPALLPHCRCLLRADRPRGRPRVMRQRGARRCDPVRLPLHSGRSRCLRGGGSGLGGAGARVCLGGASMRLRLCGARLGRGRAHKGGAQVLLRRLPRAPCSYMLPGNQRHDGGARGVQRGGAYIEVLASHKKACRAPGQVRSRMRPASIIALGPFPKERWAHGQVHCTASACALCDARARQPPGGGPPRGRARSGARAAAPAWRAPPPRAPRAHAPRPQHQRPRRARRQPRRRALRRSAPAPAAGPAGTRRLSFPKIFPPRLAASVSC